MFIKTTTTTTPTQLLGVHCNTRRIGSQRHSLQPAASRLLPQATDRSTGATRMLWSDPVFDKSPPCFRVLLSRPDMYGCPETESLHRINQANGEPGTPLQHWKWGRIHPIGLPRPNQRYGPLRMSTTSGCPPAQFMPTPPRLCNTCSTAATNFSTIQSSHTTTPCFWRAGAKTQRLTLAAC